MQYALLVEINNAYCMGHETDNAHGMFTCVFKCL